jgi:anaerobic selenocysteine-containing dehydrogenase
MSPPRSNAGAPHPNAATRTVVCSHDCPDSCSVRVGVQDGRIHSIAGDPEHPITRGFLCGKVNRYAERVYSPLRVPHPLRRIGKKGEGRFTRVSWNEALDEIATRFKSVAAQWGPEAILPYSYGGTIGRIGMDIGTPFFHRLGASRLARTICSAAAVVGQRMTTGVGVAADLEDVPKAKLILIWGINAVATHIHLMPFVKEARANGARVVVIDPYRTATARQADEYVAIRPGTDAALALGMVRHLVASGLHDRDFVERYTHGFPELCAAAEVYTPTHVEAITGVPASQIVGLAEAYGRERSSFIRMGLGISRHDNGGMIVRTIACLPALTGAWEAPGGGLLCYAWGGSCQNNAFLGSPWPGDPPARTVNMIKLGEALTELKDPPVHALYVYNSNPAAIAPEQARVQAGLMRDDLFTVVHEQMFTDTTDFADLVLPATTFMEHDDLISSYGHNYLQLSRAVIAPEGEARSNFDVFWDLARRFGFNTPPFTLSFDEVVSNLIKADARDSLDMEALFAGKPVWLPQPERSWRTGLNTPSGKFEFVSAQMVALGFPATPAHLPSPEGHLDNDRKRRYPLQLLTPPSQHFLNSTFGETPAGLRLEGPPRVKVHPADAHQRGLAAGQMCRVYNDRGECWLQCEVTEDVRPGVVVSESIWWPKLLRERKGINQLTSAAFTDLGESAQFHNALVEVERVADGTVPAL